MLRVVDRVIVVPEEEDIPAEKGIGLESMLEDMVGMVVLGLIQSIVMVQVIVMLLMEVHSLKLAKNVTEERAIAAADILVQLLQENIGALVGTKDEFIVVIGRQRRVKH